MSNPPNDPIMTLLAIIKNNKITKNMIWVFILCFVVWLLADRFIAVSPLLNKFIHRNEPSPEAVKPSQPTPSSQTSQPLINLTEGASVEVSSVFQNRENNGRKIDSDCYSGKKAIDDKIGGDENGLWGDSCVEWVSDNESEGASITILLTRAVLVCQIELYDRPNIYDQILEGDIQLDDGESIKVNALSDHGKQPVIVPVNKVIRKIKFTVTKVKNHQFNIGLAEIKVIGPAYQP